MKGVEVIEGSLFATIIKLTLIPAKDYTPKSIAKSGISINNTYW